MGLLKGRFQPPGLCRLDNCNNSERSSRNFIKTNEAPYQMLGNRTLASTLGYKELSSGHFWLSLISECISCYLYVFIVCSTRISWTGAIIGHEPNLIAMSLASGISMMLLIITFRTVHVNPALTISYLTTGRIPVIRAALYILVHCLSSIAAIAFLYSISVRGHSGALGLDNPHETLTSWQILTIEIVISFIVTIATYATCNFSSYSNAKQHVLDQVGNSSGLLANTACDNTNGLRHPPKRAVVPTTLSNNKQDFAYYDETNYEYEYDNHRIYATQQLKSDSSSSQVPIEEIMHDECQLLAPNGFALHVSTGQAFVIGLAYTLTSLSGIPASGASLNPARSFGPAFIMNRWDHHWIFWLGPILGAVIAGFFYEFIFNPIRKSSLCYRPKLFRFSAQDMAKVGSRSRLYQQQQLQQGLTVQTPSQPNQQSLFRHQTMLPSTRMQTHQHQQQHSSPNRVVGSNLIGTNFLKTSLDAQMLANSPSATHMQSSYPINFEQMNFLQQQQQQQQQQQHQLMHTQTANFDRMKSTAIINSISSRPHLSTMHVPSRNTDPELAPRLLRANLEPLEAEFGDDQVVYDDPNVEPFQPPNFLQHLHNQTTASGRQQQQQQRSTVGRNLHQKFELGGPPIANTAQGNLKTSNNRRQASAEIACASTRKPFNTVQPNLGRPHSIAFDQANFVAQQSQQASSQQQHRLRPVMYLEEAATAAARAGSLDNNGAEQLDDDLYNVMAEQRPDSNKSAANNQPMSSQNTDVDYNSRSCSSHNMHSSDPTSDSSQRTSELACCAPSDRSELINTNAPLNMDLTDRGRDYREYCS